MLSSFPLRFTIPVNDVERARAFYEQALGFSAGQHGAGGILYPSADGYFALVKTPAPAQVNHSIMTWLVPDITASVAGLKANGIAFEEYDFPGLKTVNSIATLGPDQVAWFKDSEGNLLALAQLG